MAPTFPCPSLIEISAALQIEAGVLGWRSLAVRWIQLRLEVQRPFGHRTTTNDRELQWRGREVVLNELMKPLFARFSDTYTCTAHRMIAEGDYVVVEARGKVTTKSGKAYNNNYCYVCRLREGKLVEVTEYMDTEMAAAVLGP